MLFKQDDLKRIAAGEVTLAFRRWRKAAAVAGGSQRTTVGMVLFESVERVDDVSEADALAAGFAGRAALLDMLAGREGDIYRIALRPAGADPRIALREDARVADRDTLARRLDRMGPWTRATLRLIADRPGIRAGDLAASLGREKPAFKRDVAKLKALGLTESLEVGYRLSPRGRAFLDGEE